MCGKGLDVYFYLNTNCTNLGIPLMRIVYKRFRRISLLSIESVSILY